MEIDWTKYTELGMIQQTSLMAWQSIQRSLNSKQQAVLRAVESYYNANGTGVTDIRLGEILGWKINSVTPRRGELEKLGIIYCCGTEMNPSGRPARIFKLNVWHTDSARDTCSTPKGVVFSITSEKSSDCAMLCMY